ncbi:NeuD/PglB/VioB family sugar acetyltransferase [Cellulomonas sp. P22]|uniref:NeuD/PglB/VioB family sugar acetyltransferase n=1 Tax=Cellulomonas sp. P22 TaxID=3373189 RepID=UPI00378BBC0F
MPRTQLLLVAAGGLAREVLALVRTHDLFDVVGLLDDSAALAGTDVDGVPVLGGVEDVVAHPGAALLVCAGRGSAREALVKRLAGAGAGRERFATVVHPAVEVPDGSHVGPGSVVLAGVVLTTAVTLGEHVVVMPNVTLTHDDTVEDFATLCAGVSLGGSVTVGAGAYLGMNASVRERVHVGAGATLGMGAALVADLPDGETWAGVPASRLGDAGPGRHRATTPEAARAAGDDGRKTAS